MPMRWTLPTRLIARAKQAGARHGPKTAIVLAGAAIAAGSINNPTDPPTAPLDQSVAALAPPITPLPFKAESAAPAALATVEPAPKSIDDGAEHKRIDSWIKAFSTSSAFKTSLERMEKYEDMITAKLD